MPKVEGLRGEVSPAVLLSRVLEESASLKTVIILTQGKEGTHLRFTETDLNQLSFLALYMVAEVVMQIVNQGETE